MLTNHQKILDSISKYIPNNDKYRLLADILDIIEPKRDITDIVEFTNFVKLNQPVKAWFFHDYGEVGIFTIEDEQLMCNNRNFFKNFVNEFKII